MSFHDTLFESIILKNKIFSPQISHIADVKIKIDPVIF